ncbi:zinc-binding dehydrogenase [Micromonospora arborensis]|uniref:zinc-binding dehydrogenase n=1 Tax=Micromonospora arborensis TaxID=2116518 RepID=UPI00341D66BE
MQHAFEGGSDRCQLRVVQLALRVHGGESGGEEQFVAFANRHLHRAVPDWHTAVRDSTGGRGVDRVVDTAGTLEQSLRSLAINGHVAFVGSLSGDWPPLDPRLLFGVAATVRAVAVGSHAQFTKLNEIITAHQLRPVTDRVFPFEEAGAAFRHYESANPFGKVVIQIP